MHEINHNVEIIKYCVGELRISIKEIWGVLKYCNIRNAIERLEYMTESTRDQA